MSGLQFVNELENMKREMDQLFRGFGFAPVYGSQQQSFDFTVNDNGDCFVINAPLPGLDIQKLDISVLGRNLTISGEFAVPEVPTEVNWYRQERNSGTFHRELLLPTDLDNEKIGAEYQHGILQITLPKALSALPRKIIINTK